MWTWIAVGVAVYITVGFFTGGRKYRKSRKAMNLPVDTGQYLKNVALWPVA